MSQIINIVAIVTAKEGQRQTVHTALKAMLAPTRAEAGCQVYTLHEDIKDPNVFIFYEAWESNEAIEAHMQSAHFVQLGAALEGKAESTVHIVKQCN